ncbi:hypothetical protein DH2020_008817 [Rehmannia glutinosa]|uniref:QWRF motif-containing protein n=1 Tax=Rehmannia glutinosa TaxID=99300 RepID=A0ABR0X551_REHGL
MADPSGGAAAGSTAEQPAPPPTHRRPRVREVSSRFMSPLIQSNSTPNPSDFPRPKSARHRQPSMPDENHMPEVNRSLDKSSASVLSTVQRKQQQQRVKQHTKENGELVNHQHSDVRVLSRPDTPIVMGTDRIVSSRYRKVPNSIYRSNSLNSSSNGCAAVTAAARLLQEATSDVQRKLSKISTSNRDDSDTCSTNSNQGSSSCPNSPLCVPSNKVRSVPDTRSSMSDMDKWLADRNSGNAGKVTSDCARSLNFSSSVKMGEWRFANAKAEASILSQKQEAERKVYSLVAKISEIRDDVKRKRSELVVLRGIKTLTTIIEAQMPYLTEWDTLEEDYSTSLLGATNALLSSSARLPVSGEVRADVGELGEALGSALKVVELIGSHTQRFMHKAEEMDMLVSELARMAGGERAFIEECGDLLSKTYISQVKECSLRVL